jgi:nitrate reductase delta subunit
MMVTHGNDRSLTLLKLLSVLIQYPDDGFIGSLTALKETVENTVGSPAKRKLLDFLTDVEAMPPISLQEHFTQIFDISPATCLNLTYHSLGDSEDRGRTLAELDQVYCRAGFERTTAELPDYLPLVLEFLSQCPRADGADLLWHHLEAAHSLAGKLLKLESPYRVPFELLADFVNAFTPSVGDPKMDPQAAEPLAE